MKIPIILISTEGKTKKQLLKESRRAIRAFLQAKKQIEQKEQKSSKKSSGPTKSKFVNKMLEGKSYQIMGQSKSKEKLLPQEKKLEGEKRFQEKVKRLNQLQREKPERLQRWLVESEQIPEEGESVDEFIKKTGWTLKKENEWRKIAGLSVLKNEEEYRKLFE